jgi:hypothetical protein
VRLAEPGLEPASECLVYPDGVEKGRYFGGRSQITLAGEEPWADIQSY